jgi:hypothetical protein
MRYITLILFLAFSLFCTGQSFIYTNGWKIDFGISDCSAGDDWNTVTTMTAAYTLSSLKDTLNNTTSVSFYNEDAGLGIDNNGMSTGPYPTCINQSNWFFDTGTKDFEIRNLDNSKDYSIEIYASKSSGTAIVTSFTIGATSDNITVNNNTSDRVIFNNIFPSSGKIRISMNIVSGTYSYLGSIIVREMGHSLKMIDTKYHNKLRVKPYGNKYDSKGELYIYDTKN